LPLPSSGVDQEHRIGLVVSLIAHCGVGSNRPPGPQCESRARRQFVG
jgi:hypothetical protein